MVALSEMNRRTLLTGGAALGALASLQIWRRRPWAVRFEPHQNVPGFRRLAQGNGASVSAGSAADAVFIGLDDPGPETVPEEIASAVAADPAATLYGDAAAPRMAYFTDIRCPICRPFEERLDALEAETPGLTRVTHELPIFGEGSTLAARALIAAGPTLAPRLRRRLNRTPVVVTEDFLAQVIAGLDVDPDPILASMHSAETNRRLHQSRALADLFGFYGTPALAIGRTAMLGAQPAATLRSVLDEEFGT
jgi:protein-disulfide isomerase